MSETTGSSPGRAEDPQQPSADPWAQLACESDTAFSAFQIYLKCGPGRSYDVAYRNSTTGRATGARAPGTWRTWAKTYDWQNRAKAYDARNVRVQDEAQVETLKALAGAETVDAWESGRIARQRQFEERAWEIQNMVYDKLKTMLSMGLVRKMTKTGPHGEEITIYEPVKWDMGHAAKLATLFVNMGTVINPVDAVGGGAADDAMFETRGQAASMIPDGVLPAMPENPDAKPALGASILKGVGGLQQPEKKRPTR